MKKFIFLAVLLTSVIVMSFSQTSLSGIYRADEKNYITFTGSNFTGQIDFFGTKTMSGTYFVSGNRLTLIVTAGEIWIYFFSNSIAFDEEIFNPEYYWTIVDANTIRDGDGLLWKKETPAGTSARSQIDNL